MTELSADCAWLLDLLPAVLTAVNSAAMLSILVFTCVCAALKRYISIATREISLLLAATYYSRREQQPSTPATRFYSAASAELGGTTASERTLASSYYINFYY